MENQGCSLYGGYLQVAKETWRFTNKGFIYVLWNINQSFSIRHLVYFTIEIFPSSFVDRSGISRPGSHLEALSQASKIPGRNSNQNKGHLENTPSFGEMIRICGRVSSSRSFWEVSKITPSNISKTWWLFHPFGWCLYGGYIATLTWRLQDLGCNIQVAESG